MARGKSKKKDAGPGGIVLGGVVLVIAVLAVTFWPGSEPQGGGAFKVQDTKGSNNKAADLFFCLNQPPVNGSYPCCTPACKSRRMRSDSLARSKREGRGTALAELSIDAADELDSLLYGKLIASIKDVGGTEEEYFHELPIHRLCQGRSMMAKV
jgi:hypothetical protein